MDPATLALLIKVLVGGILLPGGGVVAAVSAMRHRRLGERLADASTETSMRPGPAVVRGTVDCTDDATPAIEVVIEQVGQPFELQGQPYTKWIETSRLVRVTPFWVVQPGGNRILVEPSKDVRFIDRLDDTNVLGPGRRQKRATLSHGQDVWIVGAFRPTSRRTPAALDSAFRGAVVAGDKALAAPRRELVLREHPLEPMILSSRPFGADQRNRVLFHGAASVVFFSLTVFAHIYFATIPVDLIAFAQPLWVSLAVWIGYLAASVRLRPWYQRRRLEETEPASPALPPEPRRPRAPRG